MLYLIRITKCCGKTCYQVCEDVVNVDNWMAERNYFIVDNWWQDCLGNRICEVGCNEGSIDLDGELDVLRFVRSEDADAEELEVICQGCSISSAIDALRDSKYLDWAIFDDCVKILLRKTGRYLERSLIAELLPIAQLLDEVEALQNNVLKIKCYEDTESYNINYGEILGEIE